MESFQTIISAFPEFQKQIHPKASESVKRLFRDNEAYKVLKKTNVESAIAHQNRSYRNDQAVNEMLRKAKERLLGEHVKLKERNNILASRLASRE